MAVVNDVAVNAGVHVSFISSVFIFFRQIPRSKIAESCINSIFICLRNVCTVFHSGCTNFHSHKQCRRVPSPRSLPHLVFVGFFFFSDCHSDKDKVVPHENALDVLDAFGSKYVKLVKGMPLDHGTCCALWMLDVMNTMVPM